MRLGWLALPITLAATALVGAGNGLVHVWFRIPSFMVTLGTWFIGLGIAAVVLGGGTVRILDPQIRGLALARFVDLPWLVWVAVAATVGYLLILPIIGFFLATIVFAFALMYLGHYRHLVPATLLSVAVAFAFMFMFMRVVYVALPVGIAPFDRLSYALMAAMGVH